MPRSPMHYEYELSKLQEELIDSLQSKDISVEKDSIIEQVLRFEELLGCYELQVEKTNRGIKLSVSRSQPLRAEIDADKCDANLACQLSLLQQWYNFIKDYNKRLNAAILQEHAGNVEKRRQAKVARLAARPQSLPLNALDSKPSGKGPQTVKDKLLHTNKTITSNLLRSNQVLQTSVLQSSLNIDELQQQTSSLAGLNSKFDQLSLVLQRSSKMVRAIESSSGREKRNIHIALLFLGASIFWVIWRRLLRGPLKLMFWVWFRFFRFLLVALGAVSRSSAHDTVLSPVISHGTALPQRIANPTPLLSTFAKNSTLYETTATILSRADDVIARSVDQAFTRIFDEL